MTMNSTISNATLIKVNTATVAIASAKELRRRAG